MARKRYAVAGLVAAGASLFTLAPIVVEAGANVDVYGNYHSAGVIVTIDASDDPDGDLVASLSYRRGSDGYSAGFPLTRTRDTQLVGSLFGLSPETQYDVRVSFSDPDGGPLDGLIVTTFGIGRAKGVLHQFLIVYVDMFVVVVIGCAGLHQNP